ncbi:MAG: phosphoserine phosphatase SerB [Gammaproteobacteria bacterium]|nr:phosphoserine phosphatase SerB [Gammaproteobacteria bacterium]
MNQYCIWALSESITDEASGEVFSNHLLEFLMSYSVIEDVNYLGFHSQHCLRFLLLSDDSLQQVKGIVDAAGDKLNVDLFIKHWDERSFKPGLLIMDMDSTLVQAETIDEIARVAGVVDKVARITASAMRGELDFTESLHARVSMLEGVLVDDIASVHDCLALTEGARNLLALAKANGCHTALVSGGFTMFAAPIAESLGFDTLSANTLEVEGGRLTGKVVGDVVDGESKLRTLQRLQKQLELEDEQIIAIGDGANDLPMLTAAGTGIAFHAKPKVQEQASARLNVNNLNAVSWFLNWSESDI